MITEQYITSLFYSSGDSHLKRDIEIFDRLKNNHDCSSGHSEEANETFEPSLEHLGKLYENDWDTEFFFKLIISKKNISLL